jgi:transcriptional regulator GlxA family with amidase domain
MSSKSDTLTIGVLLLPPAIQLLDLSPVDLLAMCSRTYLSECGFPAPLVNTGLSAVTIHYISPSGSGSYTPSTASASILATASTSDEAVQPGKLDILFIPGPPPDAVPDADMKAFMRGHAESENTEVMVICTGIFAAGHAGILHGKNVTAPRGLIPRCRKMFPKVEFDGARRWKADGRVWCSGR